HRGLRLGDQQVELVEPVVERPEMMVVQPGQPVEVEPAGLQCDLRLGECRFGGSYGFLQRRRRLTPRGRWCRAEGVGCRGRRRGDVHGPSLLRPYAVKISAAGADAMGRAASDAGSISKRRDAPGGNHLVTVTVVRPSRFNRPVHWFNDWPRTGLARPPPPRSARWKGSSPGNCSRRETTFRTALFRPRRSRSTPRTRGRPPAGATPR